MQFLNYQVLKAQNLLCCEAHLHPEEIIKVIEKLYCQLSQGGSAKAKTTVFIILSGGKDTAVTLCVSADKKMGSVQEPFFFKEQIYLKQAIKTRHEGDLCGILDSVNKLIEYIHSENLMPITRFCGKVLIGLDNPNNSEELNNAIIDIYVGVNTNIL